MDPKIKYVVLMVCLLMCTVMSEDSVAEIDSTEPCSVSFFTPNCPHGYTFLKPFGSNQIGGLMGFLVALFLELPVIILVALFCMLGCVWCFKVTGLMDVYLAYQMEQELKKRRGY